MATPGGPTWKSRSLIKRLEAGRAALARDKRQAPRLSENPHIADLLEDVFHAVEGRYEPSEVLGLGPDEARRMARFGLHLFAQGDEQGALDAGRVAYAASSLCLEACVLLGALYAKQREYVSALRYVEESQKLAPDRVRSWVDGGELRLALGQYDSAANDLRRALELDPKAETPAGRRTVALIAKTLSTVGG